MNSFRIVGGKKLRGEIIPQGAKNEALEVICCVLLTSKKVTIHNITNIKDVILLIELLKELGVDVEKHSDTSYSFKSEKVNFCPLEEAKGLLINQKIHIL